MCENIYSTSVLTLEAGSFSQYILHTSQIKVYNCLNLSSVNLTIGSQCTIIFLFSMFLGQEETFHFCPEIACLLRQIAANLCSAGS